MMNNLLTKQYNNMKFGDVILKVIRRNGTDENNDIIIEDKIYCNSMILATYSGTFEEMFKDIIDSNKNDTIELDLTSIDVNSLEKWLRYMYNDLGALKQDLNTENKLELMNLLTVYNYLNLKYEAELTLILNKLSTLLLDYGDLVSIINSGYYTHVKIYNKIIQNIVLFINSLTIEKKELTFEQELLMKVINIDMIQTIYNTNPNDIGYINIFSIKKYIFIYYWWTVTHNESIFVQTLEKIYLKNIHDQNDREYIKNTIGSINQYYPTFIKLIW